MKLFRYKFAILLMAFCYCTLGLSQTIKIPEKKSERYNDAERQKYQSSSLSGTGNTARIYIPRRVRIERAVNEMDNIIKIALEDHTKKMIDKKEITESVQTDVKAKVVEEENNEGKKELNLNVEYEYEVIKAELENQTDDYPPGEYNISKSNAAKVTMTVLKETVESQLAEYLTSGKTVTIRIEGSTDASPIKGKIPYHGEFGEFRNEFCFINGTLDNIYITKEEGITTNEQLAFLRTYGVRQFIEKFVGPLRVTKNNFEHYAVVADKEGAEYRRISVELIIHDAFKDKFMDKKYEDPSELKESTREKLADVDYNIPLNEGIVKENVFALVIGNEDYTKFQTSLESEVNVDFARNDALVFSKYLQRTLGVPKDNIVVLTDATNAMMRREIEKLSKLAQYSNGQAELIFYYAGHGFPDEATQESFIMPVDVSAGNLSDGIKLSQLYSTLTKYPVRKVSVFLDACFSGGGRNKGLLSARGVKIKPKQGILQGNIVVFSASSGEQSSLPYKDKKHGMFTYFLLKKLQESQGQITYKELSDYIKQKVELNAIKVNSKEQNPEVRYSSEVSASWENWLLR